MNRKHSNIPKKDLNKKAPSQFFLSFSIQEQATFAKRLAILTKAGIPILEALHMMQKQAKSKSSALIINHLHEQLESGHSLAEGMAKFKNVFGEFAVNIVRVGEHSGTLNENLNYLADELKKKQELRRKIIAALVYPIFIVLATIGMTIVLTTYVFPKIMPIFQSFKTQLPWSTRLLMLASRTFSNDWLYIIGLLIATLAGVWFLLRQPKIRLWVDRNILRLPFLGALLKSYLVSNVTRSLGLLLKSEVRIVEALEIVASTSANSAYRQKFYEIAQGAKRGEKISLSMERDSLLFPSVVIQMASVGEATGNLSSSLMYLAEMHEDEMNNLTRNLSTSIEPVLMIFMGLLVGFIAISIITPIYGITQSIHP